MSYICTYCQRQNPDGNTVCQRPQCSISHRVQTLDRGDFVADVEILETVKVTRTATLYVGQRQQQKMFVKLSHADVVRQVNNPYTASTCDDGFGQYIKNEATLLKQKPDHPALPVPCPIEIAAGAQSLTYGKITIGNQLHYYLLFNYIEGFLLSNYLADHKQPYYQHVGWIVASVADALSTLRKQDNTYQHLGLHPDHIWIRRDEQGILRPLLLDLGMGSMYRLHLEKHIIPLSRGDTGPLNTCAFPLDVWKRMAPSTAHDFNPALAWLTVMVPPAYTSPHLIERYSTSTSEDADTDNLKLLLRQMLSGEDPFSSATLTDDQIYNAVRGGSDPLLRSDLPDAEHVMKLVRGDPKTQMTLRDFYDQCVSAQGFGPIPAEEVQRSLWERVGMWFNSPQGTQALWGVFVVLCLIFFAGLIITILQSTPV